METGDVDISGLDKAELLCALYDRGRVQGMGFLHARSGGLDRKEAEEIVKRGDYVDYLHGRVMKVQVSGDSMRADLYDRDNGRGAVQRIVDGLRSASKAAPKS